MTKTGSNGIESIRNLDNLISSGFTDTQARALLEAMSQNVATKSDVEIAKLELKREIEQTKSELKRDIEKVRADLSKDIEKVRADLSKDIEKVRVELSKDIEKVRADLAVKIEQVKSELNKDLTQRMFYFFLATVTILGSLMTWMRFFVPIVQN